MFYLAKNYLKRNKGQTITIFLFLFVLGNIICGAVVLKLTNNLISSQLEQSFLPQYQVMTKASYLKKEESVPLIDDTKFDEIGKHPSVLDYDYNVLSDFEIDGLITSENNFTMARLNGKPFLSLKGIHETNFFDLRNEAVEIIEGKNFDEAALREGSNKIIVSEYFQKLNNLKVGDVIEGYQRVYESIINYGDTSVPDFTGRIPLFERKYNLEIIGVYRPIVSYIKDNNKQNEQINASWNSVAFSSYDLARSSFLEKNTEWREENGKEKEHSFIFFGSLFILDSYKSMDKFEKAAEQILPEEYTVVLINSDYKKMLAPLTLLNSTSTVMLVASIIAVILILGLILILNFNGRRYEIGVYIALGRNKISIISQLLLEILLIATVALAFSSISGQYFAKLISNKMIDNQISVHMKEQEQNMQQNSELDFSYLENYQVRLNIYYVMIYFVLGILVVITATLLPLYRIIKITPKKLLLEKE